MVEKSQKVLGFIVRHCSGFKNLTALRILFIALVCSTLEYDSVVWAPLYANHKNSIEKSKEDF